MWIFYIILLIFYIVIYFKREEILIKKNDLLAIFLLDIVQLSYTKININSIETTTRQNLTKKSVYEKRYLFSSIFYAFRRRINCGSSNISSQ